MCPFNAIWKREKILSMSLGNFNVIRKSEKKGKFRCRSHLSDTEAGAFMVMRRAAARRKKSQKASQNYPQQSEVEARGDVDNYSTGFAMEDGTEQPARQDTAGAEASNSAQASEQGAQNRSGNADEEDGQNEMAVPGRESPRDPFDEMEEEVSGCAPLSTDSLSFESLSAC